MKGGRHDPLFIPNRPCHLDPGRNRGNHTRQCRGIRRTRGLESRRQFRFWFIKLGNLGILLEFGNASIGFSATLDGYGEWVSVDGLGRVWRPWVANGWQPYTHGRWIWTSLGWTWVAYEPWGWAPHHYGNWAYSTIGWVWSPGYVYHPGNVVWVSSGAHLGWYPCGPAGWSHFNRGYHHGWRSGYATGHSNGYSQGYADGWRDSRYATWVPRSSVTADNVADHAVRYEVATRSAARSRVTTMAGAPTRNEIGHAAGRPVPESRIVEAKATIDGRDVRIVRPEGQERTVQRHGNDTVQRALSPTAQARVTSRETRGVGSNRTGATNHEQRSATRVEVSNTNRQMDRRRGLSAQTQPTRSTSSRSAPGQKAAGARQERSAPQSRTLSRPSAPAASTAPQLSNRHRPASTAVGASATTTSETSPQRPPVTTKRQRKSETVSTRPKAAGHGSAADTRVRKRPAVPKESPETDGAKQRRRAPKKN